MATITARTIIDAPPERVWEVLADLGGVSQASPHLKASRLTSAAHDGVGASRHCDLSMPGVSTDETVTRWEVHRGYSVDIRMNRMPIRDGHADFDISVEDGRTVLAGTMRYELPLGPIGRLLDRLASVRMRSMWVGTLAGYKRRAEADEDTSQVPASPAPAGEAG